MLKRLIPLSLYAATLSQPLQAQQTESPHWNTPGAGNPFIPGYFADPTIRQFGDTYYLYATTDGTGNGYGPAQVWVSKDFVNWKNIIMNWPTTEVVWAPDVMQRPAAQGPTSCAPTAPSAISTVNLVCFTRVSAIRP